MVMEATVFPPPTEAAPVSEPPERAIQSRPNVGDTERIVSLLGGGALIAGGIARRGLSGAALAAIGVALVQRGVTGHCQLYSALGIDKLAQDPPTPSDYNQRGIHIVKAFTINKPAAELYNFWRNFENLPKFMAHLESVTVLDGTRSHWVAKSPLGKSVEWDAEIINDEPDRVIAWRSLQGADVHSAGSVYFVDAEERGTEVRVTVDYLPPLGRLGAMLAKLTTEEPSFQIQEDLRRFKQLMETGEIPTSAGPRGSCCS